MRDREPIELEGSIQTRIHYDIKIRQWVIRICDGRGLVQEYNSKLEPCMLVFLQDKYSEHPIMRTYPTDEYFKYKKEFGEK